VAGDQITFVDLYDCTQPGVYQWSLDGATLKPQKVKDPCGGKWNYSLGLLARQPAVPYVQVEWLAHGQGFSTSAVDAQGKPVGFWSAPLGTSVWFDALGNMLMLLAGDVAKIKLP
jgi:hypothetical protein